MPANCAADNSRGLRAQLRHAGGAGGSGGQPFEGFRFPGAADYSGTDHDRVGAYAADHDDGFYQNCHRAVDGAQRAGAAEYSAEHRDYRTCAVHDVFCDEPGTGESIRHGAGALSQQSDNLSGVQQSGDGTVPGIYAEGNVSERSELFL